jgi:pimeloyl-ACP methyl ester carboxylesterase
MRRFSAAGSLRVPVLNIRRTESQNTFPIRILLIHGLSASKSPMVQLASELARLGADCYLMDLPGHGESATTFSRISAGTVVRAVIAELLSNDVSRSSSIRKLAAATSSENDSPLVLLGHSFGAGLAIEAGRLDSRVAGVVALSPAAEPVTRDAPARLLVLLGEFDFPFVRRGAAFLFEEATGIRLPLLEQPGCWQDSKATHRLVVLPWADHTQTIFRADSIQEIRAWLAQLNPDMGHRPFSPWAFWLRSQVRTLLCAALLLSWFPAFTWLHKWLPPHTDVCLPPEGLQRSATPWSLLFVYLVAAGSGEFILSVIDPWGRLRLMGGGYLTGWLCLMGLAGIVLSRVSWRAARVSWQALFSGLLGSALLTVLCAPALTSSFVHLNLSAGRLWRLPIILLSVLPFYLFDEHVCRNALKGLSRRRLTFFHLSTRLVLLIALLLGFFVFQNRQFLLVLILPGLFLISLVCWCLSGWVYRHTQSIGASALFSALGTAWFFSAFFAQL